MVPQWAKRAQQASINLPLKSHAILFWSSRQTGSNKTKLHKTQQAIITKTVSVLNSSIFSETGSLWLWSKEISWISMETSFSSILSQFSSTFSWSNIQNPWSTRTSQNPKNNRLEFQIPITFRVKTQEIKSHHSTAPNTTTWLTKMDVFSISWTQQNKFLGFLLHVLGIQTVLKTTKWKNKLLKNSRLQTPKNLLELKNPRRPKQLPFLGFMLLKSKKEKQKHKSRNLIQKLNKQKWSESNAIGKAKTFCRSNS